MKKIVIGLGFGDEGKGLVTDWLASHDFNQSVVRYSGGHQVGHCVRTKTDKHIFSNFGSGTMRGLPTFWNAKTCDPVGFCKEYEDIKQWNPKIKINPNCPVTTPFEKYKNLKNHLKLSHGTMGCGFGATIQREEHNCHLYFQDLFHRELFVEKFRHIEDYYSPKGMKISAGGKHEFFDSCEQMIELVSQDISETSMKIYESSQGLMLDMEYGIFPHVTRSKVGSQEIINDEHQEFYLVTRAYQTRHGNGWCSRHGFKPNAPDETNVLNEFQGEFKTRLLDLDLLNYVLTIDRTIRETKPDFKNLIITCLDHLSDCYALTFDGRRKDFDCERDFIDFIIDNLPEFKNVFVSHGPTSEDITIYK